MFSKAKRFETPVPHKCVKKQEVNKVTLKTTCYEKVQSATNSDVQSQGSSVKSVKSFATPRPITNKALSTIPRVKKTLSSVNKKAVKKLSDDIIKAQEVEIRNKDYTITECNKHIEELKEKIASLKNDPNGVHDTNKEINELNVNLYQMSLEDPKLNAKETNLSIRNYTDVINHLKFRIHQLEEDCNKLEQEVSSKQVELTSLETIITIRDSLCKDLQEKLNSAETNLEETRQRLEMVKGHHSLALEANESIRREYKTEVESIKSKLEEEKELIINKCKIDQENLKSKYNDLIETIKSQFSKEKEDAIFELNQKLVAKELEVKAKLEQINEATQEKLKLCEIQYEERSRNMHEHWSNQEKKVQCLENEISELRQTMCLSEEQNINIQKEIINLKNDNEKLKTEKYDLMVEVDELKEESKRKRINFENQINKLVAKIDQVTKEKNKFEMSLSVTRDIVQVLTMRLRESDNELEHLEGKVQALTNDKDGLEAELSSYKKILNNTLLECTEYKEALVNILKSKAALAKEHTRIMEHNVTLIESLQNVEKEAYRELGSIKNELIEDVELLQKESKSQIQMLQDEVEKKRLLCEMAREHAGAASAAAEQSRALLAQAAAEITRLEVDNERIHQQIQDQQSLVVELSLLRQENEELTMTVAKQSSIIDKMKKDIDQVPLNPKSSPSTIKKSHRIGKENLQVISPLRERNY